MKAPRNEFESSGVVVGADTFGPAALLKYAATLIDAAGSDD